jgi:hypothetical protein
MRDRSPKPKSNTGTIAQMSGKSKRAKMAEGMKKGFSEGLVEKLKKNVPSVYKIFSDDEDKVGKGGKAPKGTKDFLTKSLRERRGK